MEEARPSRREAMEVPAGQRRVLEQVGVGAGGATLPRDAGQTRALVTGRPARLEGRHREPVRRAR